MSKILLTGATGFIGSHIAEYFVAQGETVSCLVRENSDISFLQLLGVELVCGDVADFNSVDAAACNCSSIIHVAALTRDWGNESEFKSSNIDGTLNVLRVAKKYAINRVVFAGSISSYGEENCFAEKNEVSPYNSHYNYFLDSVFPCKMNFYRDSKAQATQAAIDFAKKEGLNLIILEPVWVYGEREFHSCFYEYLKTAKESFAMLPGSKKNKFHVIYVKELARAFYLAHKSYVVGVERFIIGNNEGVVMNDFFQQLCGAAGYKKPVNVPKFIIYPIALIMELVATAARAQSPPLLTRGRVNMFFDNIEYDILKAKRLLGFQPQLSTLESIEKTVSWYKLNGYL